MNPLKEYSTPSLPDSERFLSFDRLWEIYGDESAMPQEENFYDYYPVDPSLVEPLKKLSLDAYRSCGGTGYTRIDIRMDKASGKLYMLELNAQCGLSADEDYTSIGAIITISRESFTQVIVEVLEDALRRAAKRTKTSQKSKGHKGPQTAYSKIILPVFRIVVLNIFVYNENLCTPTRLFYHFSRL
jgi:hypothetical protein